MGRQLDPGDRVRLAKDDAIKIEIKVHRAATLPQSAPLVRSVTDPAIKGSAGGDAYGWPSGSR
jgi:hypothetical protein